MQSAVSRVIVFDMFKGFPERTRKPLEAYFEISEIMTKPKSNLIKTCSTKVYKNDNKNNYMETRNEIGNQAKC